MRLLHQRLAGDRGSLPQSKEKAQRGGDQGGAHRSEMSVRNAYGYPACSQARSRDDGLRERTMGKMDKAAKFSRRTMLTGAGALVVSIGMPIGRTTVFALEQA